MKLKSIVAAAVLATAGVAAHATDYFASSTSIGGIAGIIFSESTAFAGSGGAFGAGVTGYTLYSVTGPLPGTFEEAGGALPIGFPTGYLLSNQVFAAGTYFAKVTGTGPYSAYYSTTAVPVPEPETYALMLAGLGAIGFVARRRRS